MYIDITISISLASPTCVLFIPFMQLVNGAQFLNATFLFLLFGAEYCAVMFSTPIVPSTCMYALL